MHRQKHNSLVSFYKTHLSRKTIHTLPLTLLLLLWGFFLGLTLKSNFIIALRHWIATVDTSVNTGIHALTAPTLIYSFEWITWLGTWKIIVPLAMLMAILLYYFEKRRTSIVFLLTLIGSEISLALAKWVIGRPRPLDGFIVENSFSFPSGHANIAVVFYGLLTVMVLQHTQTRWIRLMILTMGISLMLAISFSRIVLGVHFFSDVVVGFIHGLLWLWLGINVLSSTKSPQ